jgi:hypothetical protein
LEERTDSGERVNKEFKAVESTEDVVAGEESARIESVGSTDEVVTKITEPDHGFAQEATLSEKGGVSGGGKEGMKTKEETERNVEARFAKARAVRNAREKGTGGSA